jgi:DNA-binding response OmpR family regulator
MSASILIVEDDDLLARILQLRLERCGYSVSSCDDGQMAIDQIRMRPPDLVILDVKIRGLDGREVLRQIRENPASRQVPVLMYTANGDESRDLRSGADDYIEKGQDIVPDEGFEARVEALLRRPKGLAYPPRPESTLMFMVEPGGRTLLSAQGRVSVTVRGARNLDLDQEEFGRRAANCMEGSDWRFEAKLIGKDLFQRMLEQHPDLLSRYRQSTTGTGRERARIVFHGPRDHLRLPLEWLWDEHGSPGADYVSRVHAVSRSVTNVARSISPFSRAVFSDYAQSHTPLRVLLIASNTIPDIPGVDSEVELLAEKIPAVFAAHGINVLPTVLRSAKATMSAVETALQAGTYDLVHYAGHGNHVSSSPGASYLSFWLSEGRQGGIGRLTGERLQSLLPASSTLRLVYLSCCYGTSSNAGTSLLIDDFLGVADAVVHAGVPSVIGYRRPVNDAGAIRMAEAFYGSLATEGDVELALLDARRSIDRADPTWMIPILIHQH